MFTRLDFAKVGTKWELSDMKPYRKPTIIDHDGDLTKQWYVYFRYWDDEKQKLVKARRSKFPKGLSPNRIKNRQERTKQMGLLRDTIEFLLQHGWTPKMRLGKEHLQSPKHKEQVPKKREWKVAEAIDQVLKIKEGYLSEFGFRSFKAKAKDFKKYMVQGGKGQWPVANISRSLITEYLRHVSKTKGKDGAEASPRTRNNYLTELHALFEKMIEEEMLERNPSKGIRTIKESVSRHIAYSSEDLRIMGEWMEEHEPYLKMFSYFIGYSFLRPIEIVRLKVKDIRNNEIVLHAGQAKTKTTEVIPIIGRLRPVVDQLLSQSKDPEHYLFTANQVPGPRMVGGTQYFSKRFARCKDYMNEEHKSNFTEDHTLYAMRHTFIRDIYLHFRKTMTREQAEFYTMRITRHKTVQALRAYIRDYSIDLPEDWGGAYSIDY